MALIAYYTAPLSTLIKVIVSRDAESLHLPLCIMNFISMCLWLSYGLVSPQAVCCVSSFAVCLLYSWKDQHEHRSELMLLLSLTGYQNRASRIESHCKATSCDENPMIADDSESIHLDL